MIPSFSFSILVMIISNVAYTTRVGYIYNASYVSNDITTVITYKNTCFECICNGFFSNVLRLYVGLNCYGNNKTCTLFANYSTPSTVEINSNSTFIFIQQPPFQNTSTSKEIFIMYHHVILKSFSRSILKFFV
jgi:hypothetical protein